MREDCCCKMCEGTEKTEAVLGRAITFNLTNVYFPACVKY